MTELNRVFTREALIQGQSMSVLAGPEERAALAERYKILSVETLRAEVRTDGAGSSGRLIHLKARITAEITQACIISLEPVHQIIEEEASLQLTFRHELAEGTGELELDLLEEDPPEYVEDGGFDAGEWIAQMLSLAIDPYPRHTDAEDIDDYLPKEGEELVQRESPFAVLADLAHKSDDN